MNIEEAKGRLKNIAKNAVEYDYLSWDEIEAIKVLLTAYEKEKEKNKELEDTLKCTQNSWYEDTKVIIDKDKLIEELKKYKK